MKINLRPESFLFFYNHLGYRIFVLLVLSILVGLLDGFGLAMFMPLLQFVNDASPESFESLGKLEFLLDVIKGSGVEINLISVLFIMLIFFTLKGVAKFIEGFYRLTIQQYFVEKLRIESMESLSNLSFSHFISSDPGKIQNTLTGEVNRVIGAFRAYFATLQSLVMLSVYILLAFLANAQFAFLVSIGGISSNLLFRFVYKKTQQLSKKVTLDGHDYQGLLIQMVSYFQYLKATALISKYATQLKHKIVLIEKSNKQMGTYAALLAAIREPITIAVVVVVILVQVNLLGQGLGGIIMSLLFFYRALTFILNLQMEWNKFLSASGALDNMDQFLTELRENKEVVHDGNNVPRSNSILILDNLSFSFGRKKIINSINLIISPNSTVAFIGESGSGKSTLVNIISGLLRPQSGMVLFGENDIWQSDINEYRNKIGYITQDSVIFNASVFDNVTFWDEQNEQNLKKFRAAITQASIDQFIYGLPNKEYEILGHNGINLSGGQKQRISIARELYKEVDILIMDEATSALDSETENVIQSNIDRLKGSYTIIIVAHRLSTIKSVDRVFMINEGSVAIEGTFEDLMHESKEFKEMVNYQRL